MRRERIEKIEGGVEDGESGVKGYSFQPSPLLSFRVNIYCRIEKGWRLFEQQSSGLLTPSARFINLGDSHSHLLNNSDSHRVTQPQ